MRYVVTGAGGAIGGAVVERLVRDGCDVTATDIKTQQDWWRKPGKGVEIIPGIDLTVEHNVDYYLSLDNDTVVFHLAAVMGGMGFIGTMEGDRAAMLQNTRIDLNVFERAAATEVARLVYASSACVYNEQYQGGTWYDQFGGSRGSVALSEDMAWPAQPDTMYGLEKLYAEKVLESLRGKLNSVAVRLHNVYGPRSSWTGGREKAPAAMCRKVAEAKRDGRNEIEIWGDGEQRRSFLYVDDAVEGLLRLANSSHVEPINLGSDREVSINELASIAEKIAGWPCVHMHVIGKPEGVRCRNADLTELSRELFWRPMVSLEDGMEATFRWVSEKVNR